jgi:hydrogenase expression/formation protein HypE
MLPNVSSQTLSDFPLASLPARFRGQRVTLAHGGGGKAMRDLIEQVFVHTFHHPLATAMEDQARLSLTELGNLGSHLAMTTDTFVVHPLFFPGGNIGELAVNGTVNDLAMCGARPLYLSCAVVIEEGLEIETLFRITQSMKAAADHAGIGIVTGDTKVVERGAADKLFINTTGIGVIPNGINISGHRAQPGDVVITNGYLGDHGVAVLLARNELALEAAIESDTQSLYGLVEAMLTCCTDIHCLRDATRGGLATVLNELAQTSHVSIQVNESALPVRESVRGACEILGLDPLYLANEGVLAAIVPPKDAENLVKVMRNHPAGRQSAIIGQVKEGPAGRVTLGTTFGGVRIMDMLVGEQLPRIC